MVFWSPRARQRPRQRVYPIAPLARQSLAAAGFFSRASHFPYCNIIDTILRRPVEIKPSTSGTPAADPEIPPRYRSSRVISYTAISKVSAAYLSSAELPL